MRRGNRRNKWVWKTEVNLDEFEVTPATALQIAMNSAGGQAILFDPARSGACPISSAAVSQ